MLGCCCCENVSSPAPRIFATLLASLNTFKESCMLRRSVRHLSDYRRLGRKTDCRKIRVGSSGCEFTSLRSDHCCGLLVETRNSRIPGICIAEAATKMRAGPYAFHTNP